MALTSTTSLNPAIFRPQNRGTARVEVRGIWLPTHTKLIAAVHAVLRARYRWTLFLIEDSAYKGVPYCDDLACSKQTPYCPFPWTLRSGVFSW